MLLKVLHTICLTKFLSMSYDQYIRDFVLDPEYVKYLYENGYAKQARKVEKLALREIDKIKEKKEEEEKHLRDKGQEIDVNYLSNCDNSLLQVLEEVSPKEKFHPYIDIESKVKDDGKMESLFKQESEVNETMLVLESDYSKVPQKDASKEIIESPFFCDEENVHVTQLALKPLQIQSNILFAKNFNPKKVNLVINIKFKRYNFIPIFRISYLYYKCDKMLIVKDGNAFHRLITFGDFSNFPFDPGGYDELVVCLDYFFMYDIMELKFVVEFLQERGNDKDLKSMKMIHILIN